MDTNYSNASPDPNQLPVKIPVKNNRNKVLVAVSAAVLAGLVLVVYFIFFRGSKERIFNSSSTPELTLTGIILEKKSDSVNIISPNPPIPNRKPELYIIKILPETGFIKNDETILNSTEEEITLNDLKVSQEVLIRYIKDELGNFSAKKIYVIVNSPISVPGTEKPVQSKK